MITIIYWFSQDLRAYLLANNLKHVVLKGVENGNDLEKHFVLLLIRKACDFLVTQHGPRPKLEHRKSLTETIHALFPQLEKTVIYKKITERMNNMERSGRKDRKIVCKNRKTMSSNTRNDFPAGMVNTSNEGRDIEELLQTHKIVLSCENYTESECYGEEYLEDDKSEASGKPERDAKNAEYLSKNKNMDRTVEYVTQ